jgi:hypothetical protein
MARENRRDKRIVDDVLAHFKEYKTQASERIDRYNQNKKWFETEQKHYEKYMYPTGRKNYQPMALANIIEANIRTVVAVLTDAKPIMRAVGVPYKRLTPEEIDKMNVLSENLDAVLGHIWRVNHMHEKLKRIVLDGSLTGTMCARVFWDKQRYNGIGEVCIEPVHPRYIFFDQTVTDLNIEDGSCDYFIYAIPKPLSWFQYYWPGKKVKAIEDKESEQTLSDKGLYIECYKADYELEEYEGEDKTTKTRVKYPKGRRIIVGTDTLLLDEPLDIFPFAVEPISNKTETFWGEDDVYRQMFLQNELDQKMCQVATHIALSAVSQTVGDDNCGIDQDEFMAHADEPGYHFKLEGGARMDDLRNHFGPLERENKFEHELMNYPFIILEFMEKVTGVTKLIQGMAAKSERQTGFEIGKMLETATIRLRERAGHVESLIRQIGLACLEYVKNNYKEERDVWFVDQEKNEMVANTFRWPTEEKKGLTGEDVPVDYEFDIVVQPDTTLPIDLNSQADLAMRLKERGVISNAEVLKRVRYPDLSAALPDPMETPQGQPNPPVPAVGAR